MNKEDVLTILRQHRDTFGNTKFKGKNKHNIVIMVSDTPQYKLQHIVNETFGMFVAHNMYQSIYESIPSENRFQSQEVKEVVGFENTIPLLLFMGIR